MNAHLALFLLSLNRCALSADVLILAPVVQFQIVRVELIEAAAALAVLDFIGWLLAVVLNHGRSFQWTWRASLPRPASAPLPSSSNHARGKK